MATQELDTGTVRPISSSTVLVVLLAGAVFLSYVDRGLLAIAGPLVKTELGLSATEFGLAISAFFWVYAPAQLLCGWMVDRFSVYRLFSVGVGLWGVATALVGVAGGLVSLVALRTLLGLGQSFTFPGSSKMIARHCNEQQRGAANGMVMAGLAAGQAIGAFVGGMIMAAFGWRVMCAVFGALTLVWLLPWRWAKLAATGEERQPAGSVVPHREILGQRALWGSCAAHFCNNYGFYFVITWLPLYLVTERNLSIELMASLTGMTFATQTIVALAGGWASDRLIASGLAEGAVRKTIVVWSNVVKAIAIIAIAFTESQSALIACLFVTGVTIGLTSCQNFAIPQVFAGPLAAGRWVGMQNFAASISGIIGPVITGIIVDVTGTYYAAFMVAGVFTLGAAFFWGIVVPRVQPVRWRATT
jgi:MFS family permease